MHTVVWRALVFVVIYCHFFLCSQDKGRDPRARREAQFRSIQSLACHTDRSTMLRLVGSKRKLRQREAGTQSAYSWKLPSSQRAALIGFSPTKRLTPGAAVEKRRGLANISSPGEMLGFARGGYRVNLKARRMFRHGMSL